MLCGSTGPPATHSLTRNNEMLDSVPWFSQTNHPADLVITVIDYAITCHSLQSHFLTHWTTFPAKPIQWKCAHPNMQDPLWSIFWSCPELSMKNILCNFSWVIHSLNWSFLHIFCRNRSHSLFTILAIQSAYTHENCIQLTKNKFPKDNSYQFVFVAMLRTTIWAKLESI